MSPLSDRKVSIAVNGSLIDSVLLKGAMFLLASHVNVRRVSSRVPPPRTKSKKVYAYVEAMILGGVVGVQVSRNFMFSTLEPIIRLLHFRKLRVRSTSSRFSPVFDRGALRVKFSVK